MADPYEQAFAELGQALIDLDGDGRPDVAVPTQNSMRAINRQYGPMTQASREGRTAPAEMRSFQPRTAGDMVLDYGPIPAQIATSIAMQPVRAGEAVGDAMADPTLGKVTKAGAETLMAIGRPVGAAVTLAGGLGAAGLADLFSMPAEAQSSKRKGEKTFDNGFTAGQLQDISTRTGIPLETLGAMPRKRVNDMIQSAGNAAAAASQQEFNDAVKRAESARNFELGQRRKFSDTAVGGVWNEVGPIAPGLLGLVAGALSRAASGGGSAIKNYAIPMAVGTGTGAASANIPLAADAFYTPPVENPERRAYEAYARELPPNHPRRQEWQSYAEKLPVANPVREEAGKELYDLVRLAERMGMGGLEGLFGGLAGAELVRLPGRIAETRAAWPGRKDTARYGAETDAEKARTLLLRQEERAAKAEGKRDLVNQKIDENRRDAAEAQRAAAEDALAAAEAQRRIGAGTGGQAQAQGAETPRPSSLLDLSPLPSGVPSQSFASPQQDPMLTAIALAQLLMNQSGGGKTRAATPKQKAAAEDAAKARAELDAQAEEKSKKFRNILTGKGADE